MVGRLELGRDPRANHWDAALIAGGGRGESRQWSPTPALAAARPEREEPHKTRHLQPSGSRLAGASLNTLSDRAQVLPAPPGTWHQAGRVRVRNPRFSPWGCGGGGCWGGVGPGSERQGTRGVRKARRGVPRVAPVRGAVTGRGRTRGGKGRVAPARDTVFGPGRGFRGTRGTGFARPRASPLKFPDDPTDSPSNVLPRATGDHDARGRGQPATSRASGSRIR